MTHVATSPPPTFHPAPSKPSLALPQGACDTHCHIFGPQSRFPFPPEAVFRPADAPKEKLFALHEMLGFSRCVIVQSTCHGFDNSAVADAIADKGGAYLGVAQLSLTVSDTALEELTTQGFCGVRFNFMPHLGKAPHRGCDRAGGDVEALLKQRLSRIPLCFMGDGRDTANAALFLASDEARFITGTEIVVDGGMTARCD